MKLKNLLQLIDELGQVGKFDNLQQVRGVFGFVIELRGQVGLSMRYFDIEHGQK